MVNVEPLNHSNIERYQHCLKQIMTESESNIIAFGAKFNKLPCGAIFAKINPFNECQINSLFVLPLFRKKGAGTALLNALEAKLKELNIKKISLQGVTSQEKIDLLESFLIKRGFSKAEVLTFVYVIDTKQFFENNRFAQRIVASATKVPDKIKIFSKNEINKELLQKLKENIDYPKGLSPFANEFDLDDECTQFAVFDNKEIVGWLTGLRAPSNAILYRSFYVKNDFRKTALGYFLFNEAIRIHVNNHIDKKILFAVAKTNTRGQRLFKAYFKDLYKNPKFEFKMGKNL